MHTAPATPALGGDRRHLHGWRGRADPLLGASLDLPHLVACARLTETKILYNLLN